MTKNKSTKNGRFLTRVHRITETDIFTSVAIVSILMNILFVASLFVLSSTDAFDHNVYSAVRARYCKNINGVVERAEKTGSEDEAITEWQVNCLSEEFQPYYQEAVEKFRAQPLQY